MGVVTRKLREAGNQDFAAPLRTQTRRPRQELADALFAYMRAHNQQIVDKHRANREAMRGGNRLQRWMVNNSSERVFVDYNHRVEGTTIVVGYRGDVDAIRGISGKAKPSARCWLAEVDFADVPSEPTPEGGTLVVRLVQWLTDHDGKIVSRDEYAAFTDRLFELAKAESDAPA